MTQAEQIEELYANLIAQQAEISALKVLMFKANPALAEAHQQLTDRLRDDLLRAHREQPERRQVS
jgi:hypothetical protein